jgi:CRP-like cAMP-binding protein
MEISLLLNRLELIGKLSDELKIFIRNRVRIISYKKNDRVYSQGNPLQQVYFIVTGLVVGEAYVEDRSHICWFLKEQDFIHDFESFVHHNTAKCTAIAAENCILLWLSYQDIHTLKNTYPEFNYIYGRLLEDYHIYDNQRMQLLMILHCQERYKMFRKYFPWADKRLKRSYIASFLEMAPGTLSKL